MVGGKTVVRGVLLAVLLVWSWSPSAAVTVNGVEYDCSDGVCRPVFAVPDSEGDPESEVEIVAAAVPTRFAFGYQEPERFVAFLKGEEVPTALGAAADSSLWLWLLIALLAGLAMNLTPCVLPMIPVNLAVIGRSPGRGLGYAAGIAVAYGALGLAAAFGGMAFGLIQASPAFNLAVAVVFVALALSLLGVLPPLDFTRYRSVAVGGAFALGALSAVLAGACVAPVLSAVLLLTAERVAAGELLAAGLPLAMGVGMALPWPLAAAGLKVLPRPGKWMRHVNRLFALAILALAAHYAFLAWCALNPAPAVAAIAPAELAETLKASSRPVLVCCGASWCGNCTAMEARVLPREEVQAALRRFTVVRVAAEDLAELREVPGFEQVPGVPAYAIFE